MEREQAKEIIAIIEGMYPSFSRGNEEVVRMRVKIWGENLMTWDYDKAKANLMKHIETSQFPPTIADVKPLMQNLDDMTDFENLGDLLGVDNE